MIAPTFRVSRARAPFGCELDLLGRVRAVEVEYILAGTAFDDIAAVAGIPLEVVVAGAEECRVGADVAVDEVVALAAEEGLGAAAADQRVVAVTAVERDRLVGEGAAALIDANLVVAAVLRRRRSR